MLFQALIYSNIIFVLPKSVKLVKQFCIFVYEKKRTNGKRKEEFIYEMKKKNRWKKNLQWSQSQHKHTNVLNKPSN